MDHTEDHSGEGEVFGAGDRFRFDCHEGLPCFGRCCRDINIFLTPYDVLRLRRKLGIPTAELLKKYTGELEAPGINFPLFYLRMNEEDGLKCPFATSSGCAVYDERPWSCRMAPLDIAGPGLYRFAFRREKCLGMDGGREWTVEEWMGGQEMGVYGEAEKTFKEIPLLIRFVRGEKPDWRIVRLFRMACYDLDTFKEFIMGNSFLIKEGGLDREELRRSLKDDVRLLQLAAGWLINISGSEKTLKKIEKTLKLHGHDFY